MFILPKKVKGNKLIDEIYLEVLIMSDQNKGRNSFLSFLAGTAGRFLLTAIFIAIVFGAIYWMLSTENQALFIIVAIPCTYFGWKALNRITPDIFFIFNGFSGMILFYIFKGFISLLLGVFVTPFYLGKRISNAVLMAMDEIAV